MKTFRFVPHMDGKDHINLYSKGKTVAGRVLTHMSPFSVELGGMRFATLEGYWYYRRVIEILSRKPNWGGPRNDAEWVINLQNAGSGFEAKKVGRNYLSMYGEGEPKTEMTEDFRNLIREANRVRIEQHKFLKAMLLSTGDLELAHYYYYGAESNARVIHDPVYDWIPEYLMKLREEYRSTIAHENVVALVKWGNDKVPLRPQWNGCLVFDLE